jgi:Holliday junction resolvase RusA-like endonuclease
MEPIAFSMAGHVRGKQRPRATVRFGRATIYTPTETRKYERAIREIGRGAMGDNPPLEGALSVSLRLRLQPPASMSKRLRAAVLAGETPYLGRVDCDNGAKSVLDALNGVCWVDDNQIVRLWITKVPAERPGIDIRIEALEPQQTEPLEELTDDRLLVE